MGEDKIVEMFLNRGVDINIKANNGETALHKGLYKIKLKY